MPVVRNYPSEEKRKAAQKLQKILELIAGRGLDAHEQSELTEIIENITNAAVGQAMISLQDKKII